MTGGTAATNAATHLATGRPAVEMEKGATCGMPRTSGIAMPTQGAASIAGTAATGIHAGTAAAGALTGMDTAVGEQMCMMAATCGRLRMGRQF